MKKIFQNWSVFELILLFLSPTIVLTVGIVFRSDVWTISASIVGILCALFLAKGLLLGQIFGFAIVVLYSIVSFNNGFYGEMITYIVIMFPMYIYGIVEWAKNKDGETKRVKVNSIKWQEWIIICACAVVIFVGFYFLLKALNTNELIISTLSILDNLFAVYLVARRSKYGFFSYIVNDLILIVLWGIPVIYGNMLVLAMLINPIINLVNDSYAIINWTKQQKKQKRENDANQLETKKDTLTK